MRNRRIHTPCIVCETLPKEPGYTYCSVSCQQKYQYLMYIQKWKAGEVDGLQRLGIVSNHVKRYLREKYGNKCCICGWCSINPTTGRVPLVADHMDGEWRNNAEDNLRLVCPNCDALSSTYAALNKGKGRKNRPPSKRAIAARALLPRSRNKK